MGEQQYDIVVVGCGIAGLSFALYLAESRPDLSILILSKGDLPETNTSLAQGGIAAVIDYANDSFEQHIQDTLRAGRGLCDERVVEFVVKEAPQRIQDLINWGVQFNREGSAFNLHREGGHSFSRILHQKDFTGREIHQRLLRRVIRHSNIQIKTNGFAIDVLTDQGRIIGLDYYESTTNQYIRLLSKAVMLATGGSGQLFSATTNQPAATGDGSAIASRAGAKIADMQYCQFHPTVMYPPVKGTSFLISEAVRGAGGHVVNAKGERFLFKYDHRSELATRDIVTAAIHEEMKETGASNMYIRVSHLDLSWFESHFPTIYKKCKEAGIDLKKADIPIVPAAHYQCGGISVDDQGESSIERLYAGGECARTGLHGTNRLASNSLVEAVVFAKRSADTILSSIDGWDFTAANAASRTPDIEAATPDIALKKRALQSLMSQLWHERHCKENLISGLYQIKQWKGEMYPFYGTINRNLGEYLNLLENACLMIDALLRDTQKSSSKTLITH